MVANSDGCPGHFPLALYRLRLRGRLRTDALTGTGCAQNPGSLPCSDEALIKFVSADMQPGIGEQGEDIAFVLGSAVENFN